MEKHSRQYFAGFSSGLKEGRGSVGLTFFFYDLCGSPTYVSIKYSSFSSPDEPDSIIDSFTTGRVALPETVRFIAVC